MNKKTPVPDYRLTCSLVNMQTVFDSFQRTPCSIDYRCLYVSNVFWENRPYMLKVHCLQGPSIGHNKLQFQLLFIKGGIQTLMAKLCSWICSLYSSYFPGLSHNSSQPVFVFVSSYWEIKQALISRLGLSNTFYQYLPN